ncbi:hypothetical protein [Calothrix sp. PCC 7507]|uniref:hypothetical protein n=1 Tax=Calothrix sp. PCC 7507 TaxID=99598 RepID=UPI00029F266A|nr:hypothetical protein [Calothrix sp. PCC 7507]AFY35665.1 hypothetical protein Cal7507_5328 [Calothrix sp. PCC 7507]
MKDNISLIAAAAGGFMLSVALAGILRGTPVIAGQGQSSIRVATVTNSRITPKKAENPELFGNKAQKS